MTVRPFSCDLPDGTPAIGIALNWSLVIAIRQEGSTFLPVGPFLILDEDWNHLSALDGIAEAAWLSAQRRGVVEHVGEMKVEEGRNEP